MAETRCEKTDLIRASCAHCQGHDDSAMPGPEPQVEHEHTVSPGFQMAARYPSRCWSCHDAVKPGQQIVRSLTGWLCEPCAEEEDHL